MAPFSSTAPSSAVAGDLSCDTSPVSEPTTITVWHDTSFYAETTLQEVVADFAVANPLIDVELVNVSRQGGVDGMLRSSAADPDVVLNDHRMLINLAILAAPSR